MKLAVTFTNPSTGEDYGTVVVSKFGSVVPVAVTRILNQIFPLGLFPHLDPADTFTKLLDLPDTLSIPHIGLLRIIKRPA